MSVRLVYIGLVAFVWLIIGFAILPPFVGKSSASFFVLIFDQLCHQLPGRSIHIHGESLAVCARCIAIYFGVGASLLCFPRFRNHFKPTLKLLIIAASLMLGQWLFELIAPSTSWLIPRMLTGLLFGISAGLFLAKATYNLNTTPNLKLQSN